MPAGRAAEVPPDVLDRVRLAEFTGRGWVLCHIARWLAGGSSELLLTGPPGAGKTTIAAHLVAQAAGNRQAAAGRLPPGWLCAAHFCRQHRADSVIPVQAVSAIAGQLAARVPGYADAVAGSGPGATVVVKQRIRQVINSTVTGIGQLVLDSGEPARHAFDRLIRQPLRTLAGAAAGPAGVVVLIDALDESAEGMADPTLATLICRELRDDPVPGLRLLATARLGAVADQFSGADRVDLVADSPAGSSDVGEYVSRRLRGLPAAGPRLADGIVQASNGNFLYALHVVDDVIQHGRLDADDAGSSLPPDLGGIYRRFVNREIARDRDAWRTRFRPVLGALAQSRGDGLTRRHLIGITGLAPSSLDDTIQAASPYLQGERPDGPFQLFHQSFRDYLRAGGEHHIYPAEATMAILTALSARRAAPGPDARAQDDPYVLRHLLEHLHDAILLDPGPAADVAGSLLDDVVTAPAWVMEAARVLGAERLAADLSGLITQLDHPPAAASALSQVLTRQLHNLREWDAGAAPGLLLQQAHYEAAICGYAKMSGAMAAELAKRGLPCWRIAWSAGPENSPLLNYTVRTGADARPLTVTADGRRGIAGSGQGRITVWDIATGIVDHRLTGHARSVRSLSATADGTQIISSSDDGTVRVWRPGEGTHRILIDDPFPIDALTATSDHRYIAVVRRCARTAEVYEVASGRPVCELAGHAAGITEITAACGGQRLLTGSHDGTARIWELRTGRCERVLAGHPPGWGVIALEMAPDGSRVVTADQSYAPRVRVWDVATGHLDHMTDEAIEWGVQVTADGRWATTTGQDGHVRLWDLAAGRPVHLLQGHADKIFDLAVTEDGRRAITGSGDGTAQVWDLTTGHATAVLPHHGPVWAVAFTPDGHRALTGSADGSARTWTLPPAPRAPGRPPQPLAGRPPAQWGFGPPALEQDNRIEAAAISPDGRFAVTGHPDGSATVRNLPDGTIRHRLHGHRENVIAVAVDPACRHIGTGSADGTARMWDAHTGECIHVLPHGVRTFRPTGDTYPPLVHSLAFTPDSRRLVTAASGQLRIWEASTGQCAHELPGAQPVSDAPLVTPDGRHVVGQARSRAGAADVALWDISTGHKALSLSLETAVRHITVTPDCRRAVTCADQDGTVQIWDIQTGELARILPGDDRNRRVRQLAAIPGSERLAVCSSPDSFTASTVYVWHLETGILEHRLSGHRGWNTQMLASPGGSWLTTLTEDGEAFLWNLTTGTRQIALTIDDGISAAALNPAFPAQLLIGTRHGRTHYAVYEPG